MITKEDVTKMLAEFYAQYKDHMAITIYYDLKEKQPVIVIGGDESYLRSGADCIHVVTYDKNWTNNCQLELSEFLDPEEIQLYFEWMKKKYTLNEYRTEFIGNIDDVEKFLTEKGIDFYERLENYFEYYLKYYLE